MKILSWNVNGIRACLNKGFLDFVKTSSPDILGIQEIKARPEQLKKDYPDVLEIDGYHIYWNPAQKPGYSGTALFSKIKPKQVTFGLGIEEFDTEGRVILADYTDQKQPFYLFNIYYPNGQMSEERLDYKLRFYDAFLKKADELVQKGFHVMFMGDVNTAHRPIDLKNPKENEKYSGFLPVERAWIDKFLEHGYIDTFRDKHPEQVEYSWWSYRFNAREKNIGWRIDYIFVNKDFYPVIKDSFIMPAVEGSDHCPVGVDAMTD